MNWKKIILIIIPVVLLVLVVIQLKSNKKIAQDKVYLYDKSEPIIVDAIKVSPKSDKPFKSHSGSFEPYKETKVSAEVQGKVDNMLVDLGTEVKKGQTLLILDNSLLKLELKNLEIQIAALEADVNRYTILSEADAIQKVQLEKAMTGLESAKVQKAVIEEKINKTRIKAPFNGIVTGKLTEEGAFAAPGIPLVEITDISRLKFVIHIPEQDLPGFEEQNIYLISVDAFPGQKLYGKTVYIGSKSNRSNLFPIHFEVNNSGKRMLKAGLFGKVIIEHPLPEKSLSLPSSSIQGSASKPQVFVVHDNKTFLQEVKILSRFENQVVISEGIEEGDIVVTGGFINLFEGANVKVKDPSI